ncbi:hypothetical protein GUJ93_ZPchr0004g38203 [Zizania palustris]|uniref:Uncharacterized protein n=1 Tax=Zizania palustris TaxID=103762 RepID=A0A8J5VYA8_ZIZPA|nr:hypothetical protein GUJ93_ZPchr0004g38203 [Zizania palustris]
MLLLELDQPDLQVTRPAGLRATSYDPAWRVAGAVVARATASRTPCMLHKGRIEWDRRDGRGPPAASRVARGGVEAAGRPAGQQTNGRLVVVVTKSFKLRTSSEKGIVLLPQRETDKLQGAGACMLMLVRRSTRRKAAASIHIAGWILIPPHAVQSLLNNTEYYIKLQSNR